MTDSPDISLIPQHWVSSVGDDLNPSIGQLYPVLPLYDTILILGLRLGKMSSVLVSSSVLISEWLRGVIRLNNLLLKLRND